MGLWLLSACVHGHQHLDHHDMVYTHHLHMQLSGTTPDHVYQRVNGQRTRRTTWREPVFNGVGHGVGAGRMTGGMAAGTGSPAEMGWVRLVHLLASVLQLVVNYLKMHRARRCVV